MGQQTSYPNNPPAALNGMRAIQDGDVVLTKIAQSTVPIGCLCAPGTQSMSVPAPLLSTGVSADPGQVIQLPAGIVDNPLLDSEFIGIPCLDTALMQGTQVVVFTQGTLQLSAYAAQMAVPVLRKGRIWVQADGATTQFADVFAYTTAQANNPLGQFAVAAGGGKAKVARCRWLMTTTGAGLSLLEIW